MVLFTIRILWPIIRTFILNHFLSSIFVYNVCQGDGSITKLISFPELVLVRISNSNWCPFNEQLALMKYREIESRARFTAETTVLKIRILCGLSNKISKCGRTLIERQPPFSVEKGIPNVLTRVNSTLQVSQRYPSYPTCTNYQLRLGFLKNVFSRRSTLFWLQTIPRLEFQSAARFQTTEDCPIHLSSKSCILFLIFCI